MVAVVMLASGCVDRAVEFTPEPARVQLLDPGARCDRDDECAAPDEIRGGESGTYCGQRNTCVQWIAFPCYDGNEIACIDQGVQTKR